MDDKNTASKKFKFILVSVGAVSMFLITTIVSTFLSEKATKPIRSGIQNINEPALPALKLYNVLGIKIKSPAAFKEFDVGLTTAQKNEMGIVSSEAFVSSYSKNRSENITLSIMQQIHEPNVTFDPETARIETANKWKNSLNLSEIKEQTSFVSIDQRKFKRTIIDGLLDGRGPITEVSLLTHHNDSTVWIITIAQNKDNEFKPDDIIQSIRFISDN